MRFDRLRIPAFGPFTNLDLKFPAEGGDLHVIYGPNEAGKSSLLRAFRDLLFGIHGQSPDNFLHDFKKLRIEGEIVNRAGDRLVFQRRKGNKNTLLDADGKELADNALVPYLGSVDQAYFSAMFGLSTKELREGADQLLSGEGDLGSALFSASMGGTPVQLVLAALTEEAERLFKGQTKTNVTIRPLTIQYKELMRQSRDAVVNPEAWEKLERELADSETTRAKLEAEIVVFSRDLEWVLRCEDALPTVGRFNEEVQRLSAIPPLPEVSSDFVQRVRAARKAASETAAEAGRLAAQITKLETQLTGCQTSPVLLAEADGLDRLHQDLGSYKERKRSLTDVEIEIAGLETTLRTGMQKLDVIGDFTSVETLRMGSAIRLACEEAAGNLQKALDEREKHTEKTESHRTLIKTLETQLAALPEVDLTDLRDALSLGAGATEANRILPTCQTTVKRLILEVQDCHRELSGAPEDLDTTGSLSVPTKAFIRRAGEEMDEVNRNIETEETKILEGKRRIESIQAELDRADRRGELPSEEALLKAREHREHGWNLVLADWKGGGAKEEFIPGTPLEEAFPQSIAAADTIADKLRVQAEAVAQAEEKRFQIAKSEKQNCEAAARISELQGTLQVHQASWEAAWLPCGVKPGAPAAMEEWLEAWIKFKALLRQLRAAEESFRQTSSQVENARTVLAAVLTEPVDKAFAVLFEDAKRQVQQGEQAAGRRIQIANQLQELKIQSEPFEQNSARLATAVESATKKWAEQCHSIGMPKNIPPKSGLALLQERKELLAHFDNWNEVSTKSKRIKEAVRQYEVEVSEKAAALGVQGDSTETQESDMWKSLTSARAAQTRYEQLHGQAQEAKAAHEKLQLALGQATHALQELVHLAGVESAENLEPLLANLELRDDALKQLTSIRATLSGLARGQTVDDFLARIKAQDVDALSEKKNTLQGQKQEKEAALLSVRDIQSGLKVQRKTLEAAGDAAADYRQKAESCAARMKQDASLFVRLRLAAYFLQAQIERFRKENQGPLLAKSGQVFQSITRGAFSGLGAEFDADDTPVLVGLRPDNSRVSIAGMSDGTRDQLYLALRLAALDKHLETKEPMPLILDDLLITFDDDRVAAILPQLPTLAGRTQILLFTHHDHLVEICRKTLGVEGFHLHALGNGAGKKRNSL